MMFYREKCKNPHFWPILAPFAQIWAPHIVFFFQKSGFVTFLDTLKANLMQNKQGLMWTSAKIKQQNKETKKLRN